MYWYNFISETKPSGKFDKNVNFIIYSKRLTSKLDDSNVKEINILVDNYSWESLIMLLFGWNNEFN